MATLSAINNEPVSAASAAKVDMNFEVVVIPVADVDRSKEFYTNGGSTIRGPQRPAGKRPHVAAPSGVAHKDRGKR